MAAYVAIISLILIKVAVGEKLLQPTRKCVPTATIQGPCHVCVCHTDGVYHCRGKTCPSEMVTPDQNLQECEPNELYREDTTFCSCGPSGHWRSINCREKFIHLQLRKDPIKKHIRTNIACTPNNLYITDCNVCRCDNSGAINFDSCTTKPCPKRLKGDSCKVGDVYRSAEEFCVCSAVNYYVDHLCLKVVDKVVQPVPVADLAKIIDIGTYLNIDEDICEGNISFSKDCNTCSCYMNHFMCTSRTCLDDKAALRTEGKAKTSVILELKSEDDKCIAGMKYKYKCNTCICNRKGEPLCTSMICLEDLVADEAMLRQRIVSY